MSTTKMDIKLKEYGNQIPTKQSQIITSCQLIEK